MTWLHFYEIRIQVYLTSEIRMSSVILDKNEGGKRGIDLVVNPSDTPLLRLMVNDMQEHPEMEINHQ